jgi:hypothetical protein
VAYHIFILSLPDYSRSTVAVTAIVAAASQVRHHTWRTGSSFHRCLSHICPSDARCLTLFHYLLYIQPPNIRLSKHCSHCSSTIAHRAFALYPALHYLNYVPSNIPLNVTMLTYLWLLLPVLAQAAHRDPRGHVSRWNLTPREYASSTASSMAWPTGTATPSASDSPCKRV